MTRDPTLDAYVQAYENMVKTRMAALTRTHHLVADLELMLGSPGLERYAAIALYTYLDSAQQVELLPAMLNQALYSHGLTKVVWENLRSLPTQSMNRELERVQERILTADYEEVGCFLGLLESLGQMERARLLAHQLSTVLDEDVVDIAKSFLEKTDMARRSVAVE